MNDLVLNLFDDWIEKKARVGISYEYHRLMHEQLIVSMMEFQIALDETIIHALSVFGRDPIADILKSDPMQHIFLSLIYHKFVMKNLLIGITQCLNRLVRV